MIPVDFELLLLYVFKIKLSNYCLFYSHFLEAVRPKTPPVVIKSHLKTQEVMQFYNCT